MRGRQKVLFSVLGACLLLIVLYQIKESQDYVPFVTQGFYSPFERAVMAMTIEKDWIKVRDIRNHCNAAYTNDVDRFSNVTCKAEIAHRMRSNDEDEVISVYKFIDHWTEEPSLAVEIKIARNVTAYFKPCSVIPETESLDHQILEDQLAPFFSTRSDPRMLRALTRDRKSWSTSYQDIAKTCEQEKQLTSSKTAPRTPGCILYMTEDLLLWNWDNYGAKLENILPLLRCKDILLDDI